MRLCLALLLLPGCILMVDPSASCTDPGEQCLDGTTCDPVRKICVAATAHASSSTSGATSSSGASSSSSGASSTSH